MHFANLTEKERVYGHHSAEGRAIRTLSRALQGWSAESLGGLDVITLCDQAMEDWLKARLQISAWSATGLPQLLARAEEANLLTPVESNSLQAVHDLRARWNAGETSARDIEDALESTIKIIERHWC